jgi:hypothetical protein
VINHLVLITFVPNTNCGPLRFIELLD